MEGEEDCMLCVDGSILDWLCVVCCMLYSMVFVVFEFFDIFEKVMKEEWWVCVVFFFCVLMKYYVDFLFYIFIIKILVFGGGVLC